jgi:transcription elongation factor Elf1
MADAALSTEDSMSATIFCPNCGKRNEQAEFGELPYLDHKHWGYTLCCQSCGRYSEIHLFDFNVDIEFRAEQLAEGAK